MPRLKKVTAKLEKAQRDVTRYSALGRDARIAQNAARGGIVSATLLRMFRIVDFYDAAGQMPSAAHLAQMTGDGASPSGIRSSIAKLARAGYLTKLDKGYAIAKRPDPALLSRRDRVKLGALRAATTARPDKDDVMVVVGAQPLREAVREAIAALAPFAAYAEAHPKAEDKAVPILMARDHIRIEDMRAALAAQAKLVRELDAVTPAKVESKDAADPDLMSFL